MRKIDKRTFIFRDDNNDIFEQAKKENIEIGKYITQQAIHRRI